jgi:hypothetical protein
VTCSDLVCGACQRCSAPGSCTTLPAGSPGTCSSTQTCNGTSATCVACPAVPAPSDLHYVDPLGTNDANHGGGYGHCAYKTITYALTQATGQIAIQGGTYNAASGETFPLILTGSQSLTCQFLTSVTAIIQGKGQSNVSFENVVVSFRGTHNGVTKCSIDGLGTPGYCLEVTSSGAAGTPHTIGFSDIGHCGGSTINVEQNINNVQVLSSQLHDSAVGVSWSGGNSGGSMVTNTFSNNNNPGPIDIFCVGANTGVTGNGNTGSNSGKPFCQTCGNCPF